MLNKKVLPIRDFKMAAVHATLLLLLLVAIGHPVEEWAVTGAVLYVFFRLSGGIIGLLFLYAAKGLLRYGEKVSRKLQAPIPDNRAAEGNRAGKIIAFASGLLLTWATVGLGLGVGGLAVNGVGLTPLHGYFPWVTLGFAVVGLAGLVGMFGLVALALYAVDNLSAAASPKFDQFQATARGVDSRLRWWRLIAQTPGAG